LIFKDNATIDLNIETVEDDVVFSETAEEIEIAV